MKKVIVSLFGLILINAFVAGEAGSQGNKAKILNSRFEPEPIHWHEGAVKKQAWMARDEVAVFPIKGKQAKLNESFLIRQFHSNAKITEKNDFVMYLRTPEAVGKDFVLDKLPALKAIKQVHRVSPVFYAGKSRHPETRLVLTGEIIVKFPSEYTQSQIEVIESDFGLERLKSFHFSENTFLYGTGDALNSLNIANSLYQSGQAIYAYPNWFRGRTKRYTPNDPLFPDQWHLENTGQGGGTVGEDVNIVDVWDSYQGSANEVIAIVDDGLEIGHGDLWANVIPSQSWDYVQGDTDPTAGDHGTSCAGVAAGRGDNSLGITGAAFHGGLVGHRLLGAGTDANEADALTRNNGLIDIYSNSWGPWDDGQRLEGPGPLTENALENGITNGRGGLGSIYVWAGGNGQGSDDNANYDGYANSRYTIAVAASTNYGEQAYYSENGANLLVNAPSNGGSLGITTTDRTGALGYDFGNYTDSFGGTSAAAPLASGTIALMLEANPNLTWRDLQYILMKSAEQNDPTDPDWTTNGAGCHINHKYGFGRIDTERAVNTALFVDSAPSEVSTQAISSPNLAIPDHDLVGVTDTINITEKIRIEFVEIYFTAADHTYWGDLEIVLVSPEGTESVLAEAHASGSSYTYNNWRFGSVRHFGESSEGDWTLRVRDLQGGDTGTFQSWTLVIHGFQIKNEIRVGEEFQVNTFTENGKRKPSVAGLPNGYFVVTWSSYGQDGNQEGVYGQIFDRSGSKIGNEFQINSYTMSDQRSPEVAVLASGGFTVIWESYEQDGSGFGVYGQLFDSEGNKVGGEFQVNTHNTYDQGNPSVAPLTGGGFVVMWESTAQDGSQFSIYGQIFDTTGIKVGNEFKVNTSFGSQYWPSVAGLLEGGFVGTWTSGNDQDGSWAGVFGQIFDSGGNKVGGEFQINSYTDKNQYQPSVAGLSGGGFVVTWSSDDKDGNSKGVFGQLFDSEANKVGGEFQANTYTTYDQHTPSVAPLNSGGFVVTWESWTQDGSDLGIFGQMFDNGGNKVSSEFQVNTNIDYTQWLSAVAPLESRGFVVAWESENLGESYWGIYGQIFDTSPLTVSPLEQNFGTVNIGCTPTQPFTMTNLSDSSLEVDTLTITGQDTSEFFLESDTCSGNTLSPSGTCTFNVAFEPVSLGSKSATVEIPFPDPDVGTIEVPLSGLVTEICECDLNQDNSCDGLDWLLFYPDWGRTDCTGSPDPCECDLNNDGSCNGLDWLLFYPDWGRTDCPLCP
jgi:kexin